MNTNMIGFRFSKMPGHGATKVIAEPCVCVCVWAELL